MGIGQTTTGMATRGTRKARTTRGTRRLRPLAWALVSAGCAAPMAWGANAPEAAAVPEESTFHLGGYVRGWVSMNLQDQPETSGNDKYKLSMVRASLMLDADWKPVSTLKFKAIGRADREVETSYLKSLQVPPNEAPAGSTASVFSTTAGGNIGGLMNNYNQSRMRELWAEWEPNSRTKIKFGKQQIVWGETDFFRAMDVVQGFDYRWRSFLEAENEELRKPLVMARLTVQVPEAKGAIDAFVRPGWGNNQDVGNTYDLNGGRWASQPARGAGFLYATSYNYESEGADSTKTTGGLRWSGVAGPVNYSLAYLRTFNNDPVANPCPETLAALYGGAPIPAANAANYSTFKQRPSACGFNGPNPYGNPLQFGDWIFPKTDILGLTASTYSGFLDSVLSTEIVFQKGRSFNYGFNGGKFGTNITPGAFGIIQKNTLTTMFRIDKQVNLSGLIGTSRPSFASIQFFNTRILDFQQSDEIVQLAYWSRARAQNSAILTGILAMNYNNDRINPTIAAGWDVSYGGGFFIPSVEFVLGDNWRLKTELDLFYTAGNTKNRYLNPNTGALEEQGRGASLFGYFANSNQFMVRLTRQF